MTCSFTFLAVLLISVVTFAAPSGDGHHADGIPVAVLYQAINFAIFVGLGFFFLRRPVSEYFANREKTFKAALIKAEAARKEAERGKREIEERLAKLQATAEESIARARQEADEMKGKIIRDAAELSEKLRQDAQITAAAEIERAKRELSEEVLTQAIAQSRKILSDKMAEQDQKRLQTEFVEKIQVVR